DWSSDVCSSDLGAASRPRRRGAAPPDRTAGACRMTGSPAASQLSPGTRAQALRRMASTRYDVLVLGGGVTGAGVALDAATRGLSVALVEMRDYAAGTSGRSGKLI